ncbi:hypothetical protein BKA62DRAFT_498597 [Auriculariales sp. MPI-PUGE-AT-0066]|nr:hypothetical protein BKA62DRAFT_498597 [Auriculariales sp. MPI-PUGE-AT-0066]
MKLPTFRSIVRWGLIGISYIFLVLVALLLIVATAAALLLEAKRRSRDATIDNLKALYIGLGYVILAVATLTLFIVRGREIRNKLARIPQNHVAIREEDVPKSVHVFISHEYLRCAAILAASQPTNGNHEGWGEIGTEYEGIRLRRRLLDTIHELNAAVLFLLPSYPPIRPTTRIAEHLRQLEGILVQRNKRAISSLVEYDSIIEFARYAQREPTMDEFLRGMRAANDLIETLRTYEPTEEPEPEEQVEGDVILEQDEEEESGSLMGAVPILNPYPQPRRPAPPMHSITT